MDMIDSLDIKSWVGLFYLRMTSLDAVASFLFPAEKGDAKVYFSEKQSLISLLTRFMAIHKVSDLLLISGERKMF